MRQRIEYIDALRGFTMLLVVFAHVETVGFFGFSYSTFMGQLFQSFRMPLFFFISGFIAYRSGVVWNLSTYATNTLKKLKVQLIPTIVFGMIYTYPFIHSSLKVFISMPEKFGFWFTIALLEMFLVYYTINYLCHFTKHAQRNSALCAIAVAVIFFLLRFPFKTIDSLAHFGNVTSLHYTFAYFQYFVFGNIAAMFKEQTMRVLDNKYVIAAVLVLFVTLFCVYYHYFNANTPLVGSMQKALAAVVYNAAGYMGIILVFNFFRIHQDSVSLQTWLGRNLQYVGRRTLDIYMIHNFLIPSLPQVGSFLIKNPNPAVELFLGLSLSILVVVVCLVISNVIRESDFLAYWLFGAKKKQNT